MSEVQRLAAEWYEDFNRNAGDLYPGRYTAAFCRERAELAVEILRLAREKGSVIAVHNYLYPEFHRIATFLSDSLSLARMVRESGARRVDFASVFFMGATAKIDLGDRARVFVPNTPQVLGCSLVSTTDYAWIERWKALNPGGVLVIYINSSAYAKCVSDYVMTSGNAAQMIARAVIENPGKKVLVLPDKFLGMVMRAKALDPNPADGSAPLIPEHLRAAAAENIEIYTHAHGGFNASCYVHEQIGDDAPETALEEYPDAELMIHPECGCASSCLLKLEQGILPRGRVYYLSTEQMVEHARRSAAQEFVVATEIGLIYRLRRELPHKTFHMVSSQASCQYMKRVSFEDLAHSLREDRLEIVFCDDCCDFQNPYQDDRVVHIPRTVANGAGRGIGRMFTGN